MVNRTGATCGKKPVEACGFVSLTAALTGQLVNVSDRIFPSHLLLSIVGQFW